MTTQITLDFDTMDDASARIVLKVIENHIGTAFIGADIGFHGGEFKTVETTFVKTTCSSGVINCVSTHHCGPDGHIDASGVVLDSRQSTPDVFYKLHPSTIKSGVGLTIGVGGDMYAYTVRDVSGSGKTIWVSQDSMKRVDNNGPYSEDQTYEFTLRLNVPRQEWRKLRWHEKNGRYYLIGTKRSASPGRRAHLDPHK